MNLVDVEVALDEVEAAIREFHADHDTRNFVLLQCGPDPQHMGVQGGPIGLVEWSADDGAYEECRELVQELYQKVECLPLIIDIEVERHEAFCEDELDGETWYLEFAPVDSRKGQVSH